MTERKAKVLLAMSGGVDSSVAAALLLRAGYDVVGCFMRLGSPGEALDDLTSFDEADAEPGEGAGQVAQSDRPDTRDPTRIRIGHRGCCSINDAADARLVAAHLGIPLYVCNFRKNFGRIIDYFVDEYNAGRTPNPCARCNDWLKFGKLHEYARQIDAGFVASGHHARLRPSPFDGEDRGEGEIIASSDHPRLLRGVDPDKDQSYVLFGAPQERLCEMLLPVGHHHKSEIRALAQEFDLPVHDKPESQEICFVPDNDYAALVKRRAPDAVRPGAIVDTSGRKLGEHEGHQHFTIGQRRGIRVALGYPIYVVHKDPRNNIVTVGEKNELLAGCCCARETNWFVQPSRDWMRCAAKIRYNAPPVGARVRATGEDEIEVRFDEPQFAVAPGQAVVCYDGETVLCGGWIC